MNTQIQKFEEYKLIYYFMNPDVPLKGWINENNFINLYAKDWNELMEVVEKMENLKTPITNNPYLIGQFENYEIHIENKFVMIYAHGEVTKDVCNVKEETKIKSVYNACLEFIKWYNKQN
nr:hypothetical protein [uncultured Flavobacterium sp.]